MSLKYIATSASAAILAFTVFSTDANAEAQHEEHQIREFIELQKGLPESMPRFVYDSGLSFEYPDAVRGIYVTGHSAGGARFETLLDLMDTTDLNSMVIDVKEDHGYLTYVPDEESPFYDIGQPYIKDMREMLETLEKHEVYPIARVVVFKDSVLAEKRPELSFQENGQVWANGRSESFVNPFMKEVWDYNVEIAIEAAKMGFKEIQFDYVRFPEGFETRDDVLEYGTGDYADDGSEDTNERVDAVTDFVEYASSQLEPYDVDVSVDIFGYSATLPEAPGIGQNFNRISEHVDVISSMIYPSHWTSYFGIDKPDLEPYNLISEYAKVENAKLSELEDPPTSRPWIQDFTASYLGAGNYLVYGPNEVKAQIDALYDNDINEFLLWNAGNTYTGGVDYLP